MLTQQEVNGLLSTRTIIRAPKRKERSAFPMRVELSEVFDVAEKILNRPRNQITFRDAAEVFFCRAKAVYLENGRRMGTFRYRVYRRLHAIYLIVD
jgi:hypothetical protein